MRKKTLVLALAATCSMFAAAAAEAQQAGATAAPPANDPVQTLVGRLDLEKYKATIKGLTQFGDRRQGTKRNRAAVDWIEVQLKSYGCPTERIHYEFNPPPPQEPASAQQPTPSPVIASGEVPDRRRRLRAIAA
jgi:ferredoxin-NADP reductase